MFPINRTLSVSGVWQCVAFTVLLQLTVIVLYKRPERHESEDQSAKHDYWKPRRPRWFIYLYDHCKRCSFSCQEQKLHSGHFPLWYRGEGNVPSFSKYKTVVKTEWLTARNGQIVHVGTFLIPQCVETVSVHVWGLMTNRKFPKGLAIGSSLNTFRWKRVTGTINPTREKFLKFINPSSQVQ